MNIVHYWNNINNIWTYLLLYFYTVKLHSLYIFSNWKINQVKEIRWLNTFQKNDVCKNSLPCQHLDQCLFQPISSITFFIWRVGICLCLWITMRKMCIFTLERKKKGFLLDIKVRVLKKFKIRWQKTASLI